MTRAGMIARVSARDAALRRLRWGRATLAVSAIALLGALTNAAARSFPGHVRAATAATAQSRAGVARSLPAASHRRSATRIRGAERRRTTPRSGRATRGPVIAPPAAPPTTPAASPAPAAPVVSGGS
jgi:hypothetical protein